MPYCPECGNEVSRSDKRCSKCGTLLTSDFFADIPKPDDFISNLTATKPKDPNKRDYHNIEFILAIIAVILSVYSISLLPVNTYNLFDSYLIFLLIIPIILGIIGAFVVRYYAKTGAIILLITVISLLFIGVYDFLPLLFYVITIILCFVRY